MARYSIFRHRRQVLTIRYRKRHPEEALKVAATIEKLLSSPVDSDEAVIARNRPKENTGQIDLVPPNEQNTIPLPREGFAETQESSATKLFDISSHDGRPRSRCYPSALSKTAVNFFNPNSRGRVAGLLVRPCPTDSSCRNSRRSRFAKVILEVHRGEGWPAN